MARDGILIETISKQVFEDMQKLITQLNEEIKLVNTLGKEFKKIKLPSGVAEKQKESTVAVSKTRKAVSAYEKQLKSLMLAQQKQLLATTKINKSIIKARFETQQLNKQVKEEIILSSKLSTEYQKQQVRLTQLKRKYADLILKKEANGRLSKQEERQLLRTKSALDRKDRALKNVDAQMGVNNRHVGDYKRGLSGLNAQTKINTAQSANYKRSLMGLGRSLVGAFGVVSGVMIFAQVMRSSVKIVADFDKSMVDLSAVLGVNREKLTALEDIIRQVAATSTKTANEVADLASTLATLGKTEQEIRNLLKPVNDLSIALDATSADAGELLVQTLNAFGKGSDSATEFADIIAKMRTSTALDFERIKDALGFLAPTARAVGLSFAETGSILGVLVDNGIKAARAGRIMSSSFVKIATEGITLNEALEQVRNSEDKLVTSGKLFGKQGAALGLILADNKDKMADLTKEFDNAGGSLDRLTKDKMSALTAQLELLSSAWTEFILSIESGEGVISRVIVGLFGFWAKSLSRFSLAMDDSASKWMAFKIAVNRATSVMGLFDGVFNKSISRLEAHNKLIRESTEDIGALTKAQSDLNDKTKDWFSIIRGGDEETKKTKKGIRVAIKGTIEDYELQIKKLKDLQTQTSLTNDEFEKHQKKIDSLGVSIDLLNGSLEELESNFKAFEDLDFEDVFPDEENIGDFGFDDIDDKITEMELLYDEMVRLGFIIEDNVVSMDKFSAAWDKYSSFALDAINLISDAQKSAFDKRISQLDTELQIALQFAGDSEAAKADIEERFAEKKRKLQVKRFKQEKNMSILQANINMATAIIKTFAELGWPAGMVGAAIITALGAAQIAIIKSQSVPAFEKGTRDFEGGTALINEKRNEIVTTPDGQVFAPKGRNMLVDLPKGSNVYKSESDFNRELNGILNHNGIGYGATPFNSVIVQGNNLSKEDLESAFKSALKGRANNVTSIDKNGFSTYAVSQLTKRNILNNRVVFKGKNV